MAASRLLHAVAACVILLSFAAGLRKSYWSGCMEAATVICQQIFSILALVIFLLKILLKSASKAFFFFALASRSGFGATISDAVARSSLVFCNSVSADRIVMAAWRLLHAVAACAILLSFAAGVRKSYWSGCMKAATVWTVKCEVWSVKCGVWSFKFGVRRVQCEVWSVHGHALSQCYDVSWHSHSAPTWNSTITNG